MRRWRLTCLLVVLLALAGTTLGSPVAVGAVGAVGATTFVPATQSANLLKNSSFEGGSADWSLSASAPAAATMFNEKPSGHVQQVVVTRRDAE